MLQRIARHLLIQRSIPIFIVLAVLGGVGAYLASKVQLKLSLTDLLPENHPAVVKFEKLTEVVGGVGYLAIVLHAEDQKSHLEVAPKIKAALEGNPLVRTVFSDREERFFVDRLLYYLDVPKLEELDKNIDAQVTAMRRKLFDIGIFDEGEKPKEEPKQAFDDELKKRAQRSAKIEAKLISPDHKHLLVMIKPTFDSTDIGKTKQLLAETETLLGKILPANVTWNFAERYYNKIIESELIQKDIFLLGSLSILAIALILLAYLRSVRALFLIFVPVFIGLGITGGLTYLFIGHINIVTGFLMGIVSGLGVDYGIHLYLRLLLEKREPSSDDPDAVWRTLASSGHSVFTGAMAAAFAFFLLCFSSFRAFSEFGFICGVGITAVLLCLLGGFRALARLLRLDGPAPVGQAAAAERRGRFPVLSLPKGYYAGIVVTVVLTVLGFTVRFEYDFDKMLRHSVDLERLTKLVDEIYGRSVVPSALATPSKEDALAIEKRIKEKYMPGLVHDMISGASIVPDDQEKKQVILERIAKRLEGIKDRFIERSMGVPASAIRTWLAAKPFTFADLPLHIQDMLRGTQRSGYLLYVYPAIKLSEASAIHRYAGMVRDIEATYPNTLTGSDAVVFSDILNLIQRDGARILLVIFLAVGGFIWLNTRKLGPTLTTYLPLLISLPVGMGLMALFGVRFNIFNITIIPTFVAMGIDVPIHIVHRAHETGSGYKAAKDLAPSINLALMTAALGFGVLVFANANVLKSLGWIALLGTFAIWWVGLFVLPAFLEWSERRKHGKTSAPEAEAKA